MLYVFKLRGDCGKGLEGGIKGLSSLEEDGRGSAWKFIYSKFTKLGGFYYFLVMW